MQPPSSVSNPYDAWTPDLQVKALKRCSHVVYIATLGIVLLLASTWFELPVTLSILFFLGMTGSFIIAGIIYASTGMMSSSEPYGRVRFSDEYCREVIYQGYRAVVWWLMAVLLAVFLLADFLFSRIVVEPLSVSMAAGLYVVIAALIWAGSVSRALSDKTDEDSTEEAEP